MTRTKKIIYTILALIIIGVAAFWAWRTAHAPSTDDGTNPASGINTYRNTKYGFEVTYSKSYQFKDEADELPGSDMYMRSGINLARIDILRDKYPNTNLSESWLGLAIGKNMTAQQCNEYLGGADAQVPMTNKQIINGVEFTNAEFNGAGAGNLYETRLYRNMRNSICYEISLTLHTTNVGNYPAGTVTEVNKDDLWNKLAEVLSTFKYITATAQTPTPTPVPVPTPTPSPNPVPTPTPTSTATTGMLTGHADLGASKINKIIVYNSTGKVIVSSTNVDANGNYSLELAPGDYKIDYQASPDLYPHSPESFSIVAGQTHEVDFSIEN